MAGSAGRPTRRATDSSYGSRAHPDRGKRTANQRLKLTGAAILVFRASAFRSAVGPDRPKPPRINRLRCRRTDAQNDFEVETGRPERTSRERICADQFKSCRPEALGPGRRYTHWLTP